MLKLFKYYYLLTTILLGVSKNYGQNLVLNPSFENVNPSNLRCSWYLFNSQYTSAVNNWDYPTLGSTDLFHMSLPTTCYSHPLSSDTFSSGQQLPRTGNAMSNIVTYGSGGCSPYREYLQGELSTPLTVGVTYNITIYVSCADYSFKGSNNIGVKFTTSRQSFNHMCVWETTPDVNYTGSPITDRTGWTQLNYRFTPTTPNLLYFSIGNFITDANTTTTDIINGYRPATLYFVDDISITPTIPCTVTANATSGQPTICANTSTTLLGTASNGVPPYSYTWSPTTGLNNPNIQNPTASPNSTTTYTLTVTDASLCQATSSTTINVTPLATPTFTQIAPICEGETLNPLPTVSNNGISGSWTPSINNTTTTTYTFTPSAGQCAISSTMTVVVNPKVTPTFNPIGPLCYASTFVLPTISTNGISGIWSPAVNNTVTTTYNFMPDTSECARSTTLNVPILKDFDFEINESCKDGEYFLTVNPINNSFSINNANYNWEFNNQIIFNNNHYFNLTTYLKTLTTSEKLPFIILLTVTNADGCKKSKSFIVNNTFCGIQKGISPNNDGDNDFFDLRLLNVKNLSIFNRYGVKVYSKENYANEWYGQTNEGDILPDGTYYYTIEFYNDNNKKSGWIYINK